MFEFTKMITFVFYLSQRERCCFRLGVNLLEKVQSCFLEIVSFLDTFQTFFQKQQSVKTSHSYFQKHTLFQKQSSHYSKHRLISFYSRYQSSFSSRKTVQSESVRSCLVETVLQKQSTRNTECSRIIRAYTENSLLYLLISLFCFCIQIRYWCLKEEGTGKVLLFIIRISLNKYTGCYVNSFSTRIKSVNELTTFYCYYYSVMLPEGFYLYTISINKKLDVILQIVYRSKTSKFQRIIKLFSN